jgi:pimeloyl-ACP methyl ester carboxylesterase
MKNILKQTLLLLLFISINTIAQNRNVAWVHGLGGNYTHWQHYEQIFSSERDLNSRRTSYNTNVSITNSSDNLKEDVDSAWGWGSQITTNPQNLGIGHSLGGVMIRNLDRLTPPSEKRFGGYITVASPNYGAPIANSLQDGSVLNAKNHALNELEAGPRTSLLYNILSLFNGLTITDMVNSSVGDDLAPNPSNMMYNDLKTGSPTINAINNYTDNINPNIPRISIWANENSPVHWRLASTVKYGDETTVPNSINIARAIYMVMHVENLTRAIGCTVGGFWNPWCWASAAVSYYKAAQWKRGVNWFDNSENIWNGLIKTTRREEQLFWESVFTPDADYDECMTYQDYDDYYDNWYGDCGTFEWQWVPHLVSVNYPSDGFLPKYTQIMENNPTPNSEYEVESANHQQVLDMSDNYVGGNLHDNTRDTFNLIFNRGDWFHTN